MCSLGELVRGSRGFGSHGEPAWRMGSMNRERETSGYASGHRGLYKHRDSNLDLCKMALNYLEMASLQR